MYAAIWRLLPGPRAVRLVLFVALLAGVAALFWYVVFPWVDARVEVNPSTVG